MKATINNGRGANVISIEVARAAAGERVASQRCAHMRVRVDPLLAAIECQECGAQLNAVEWIALVAEHWSLVDALHEKLRLQKLELDAVAAALDRQRHAKCQHCHRITRVRLPRVDPKDLLTIVPNNQETGHHVNENPKS